MAFLICNKTPAGNSVRYERIKSLKLGGPDGLIARHVKSLPANQSGAWKLDAPELASLAGATGENLGVLFDAAPGDATTACVYELTLIHGSCRDRTTNLALDFNVVADRELAEFQPDFTATFEAPLEAAPKKLREILALTGGPEGGDWKWGESPIQLGATVVPAHHNGPPCPNCSCGRAGSK
jgi:hypothetical protein